MKINDVGDLITDRTMYNIVNETMRAADSMQITMIVVY